MTSPDSPSPAIAPLVALVRNGAGRDQERAAGALANLARNDTNRVAIAEALVVAANGNNYEQIVRAMKTFANDDSSNRAALAKALVMAAAANGRGIQLAARTVERFTRGDAANRLAVANAVAREGDQAWVARAMHSLTYGHAANRATIAAGLVALMASKRDQNRAARAMETFSRGKADNCGAIAEADGIAALVQHVASGKAETATLAVLRRLACDAVGIGTRYFLRVSTQLRGHTYVHADILAYIKPKNRATIVDALVALVASGAAGGQERAAAALAILACDVPNQTAIAAAGGFVALVPSQELPRPSSGSLGYVWFRAQLTLPPAAERRGSPRPVRSPAYSSNNFTPPSAHRAAARAAAASPAPRPPGFPRRR